MNRVLFAAAALFLAMSPARAEERMTLQLKWLPQAQFAGYYVAKEKGYYRDAGLDVAIAPGGPDIDPARALAEGRADVVTDWMPSALAAREQGVGLVNIAQLFQRSGMMLVCRKDQGIETPYDLAGHTLAVWYAGNEYPFLAWMDKLGVRTDGRGRSVRVLKQGAGVEPLLDGHAACISAMSYNEYWQILDAGLAPERLVAFSYEDEGVATLEDGLYALERSLADPAAADRLVRFLRASMKGWAEALQDQAEAVRIVLANAAPGTLGEAHQRRMLSAVAKLVQASGHRLGRLDPASYERTVSILLAAASDPVTKPPVGAWTHQIWDEAAK
jgi:NitT/TauT family transport system substrate-binding protein